MKKILVLLSIFLLFGCAKEKLERIEIDRNHYATTFEWVPIGISEKGLYYVKDEILYFKSDQEDSIPLGSVNYVDGNKTQIEKGSFESKIRIDMLAGRDLICYGDRIFMEYHTINHDMSEYYHLASVDLKGEDFKSHITFDYIPNRIVINNGKIYVYYSDSVSKEKYIEIYDESFNLISTEHFDESENVLDFYIKNDELIIPNDISTLYEDDNVKISYKTENLLTGEDMKTISTIQIGEKEYTFENKTILFVNDNYFYVASDIYPQVYERYYLNGELDKAIVINEHIESTGTVYGLYDLDFSYILKLKNENIVYGYSNSENPRIFVVDFENNQCNYVE